MLQRAHKLLVGSLLFRGHDCVSFTRLRRKPRLSGLRSRSYFGGVG